ncbi:cupredoxin domain-containing protein [Paenibacillus sp. IB182363]|uniref:Cupredoxin domain-containing protein n=1 Tax=Paenibacillus oceani TaxID=2772510 RepID=A0A927H1G0_9BACL|nr:cupredoxin domain-containing protein [Paenibacillus oceani]
MQLNSDSNRRRKPVQPVSFTVPGQPKRRRASANLYVLKRKHLLLAVGALVLLSAFILYASQRESAPVAGAAAVERTIHLVTGEFKSTTPDGKEIEAYRWDPGTVVVHKGDKVKLSIYGVNGASHPFIIEGLGIKGEVKKGEETVVTFKADKEGTYRIICLTHPDIAHNGPMIGYIIVD